VNEKYKRCLLTNACFYNPVGKIGNLEITKKLNYANWCFKTMEKR